MVVLVYIRADSELSGLKCGMREFQYGRGGRGLISGPVLYA